MKIKSKFLPALLLAVSLTACGVSATPQPPEDSGPQENVEIRLWTYPVGSWGESDKLASLINDFHQVCPHIWVSVEYLDYQTGDAQMEQAIEAGAPPDLVLEGPERLVANWGERGLMADLSGLWASESAGEIYPSIRDACRHRDGAYYEFPLCMSTHCMAINYELFEAAGALQYIDQKSRTWSAEDFVHAVEALRAYGQERVAAVYCGGQGGDQGTRALVTNLGGGSFTDQDHTGYVFDSEENIQALQLLYGLDGVVFDPTLDGQGEIALFSRGELAMSFCWNVSLEVSQTVFNPSLDFDMFPMAFPTKDGAPPRLESGIWGFGVFDNGDPDRIEAAKAFIRYMTEEDGHYARAVLTSMQRPVRELENLYDNDALMSEYSVFPPYMGDYCQITPRWVEAREVWWQMLQSIAAGEDIAVSVHDAAESLRD